MIQEFFWGVKNCWLVQGSALPKYSWNRLTFIFQLYRKEKEKMKPKGCVRCMCHIERVILLVFDLSTTMLSCGWTFPFWLLNVLFFFFNYYYWPVFSDFIYIWTLSLEIIRYMPCSSMTASQTNKTFIQQQHSKNKQKAFSRHMHKGVGGSIYKHKLATAILMIWSTH